MHRKAADTGGEDGKGKIDNRDKSRQKARGTFREEGAPAESICFGLIQCNWTNPSFFCTFDSVRRAT